MSADALQALRLRFQVEGEALLVDVRRCESLLRDLLPTGRREVAALLAALRCGVPQELLRSVGDPTAAATAARLAVRLHEEEALAIESARWAVDAWSAIVLGTSLPAGKPISTPSHGGGSAARPAAEVYREAVAQAVADGVVTKDEESLLGAMRASLGLSDAAVDPTVAAPSTGPPAARTGPLVVAVLLLVAALGGGGYLLYKWLNRPGPLPLRPPEEIEVAGRAFEEALAAHREWIEAFIRSDELSYRAFFQDPLDCFYNVAQYTVDEIMSGRRGDGLRKGRQKGRQMETGPVKVLHEDSDIVILQEGDHPDSPTTRLVKMRRLGSRWLVAAEASMMAHHCWPEAPALLKRP